MSILPKIAMPRNVCRFSWEPPLSILMVEWIKPDFCEYPGGMQQRTRLRPPGVGVRGGGRENLCGVGCWKLGHCERRRGYTGPAREKQFRDSSDRLE